MTLAPLIFLDTETTGLDPTVHAPWEVAWVTALDHGDQLELLRRRSLVLQLDPTAQLDHRALDISRFYERYGPMDTVRLPWWVVHRMLTQDVGHLLAQLPGFDGLATDVITLVGANPAFDQRMLERWLSWSPPFWSHRLLDVPTLVGSYLGYRPPYSLRAACEAFEITVDANERHTAAGDVDLCIELYARRWMLPIHEDRDA